MLGGVEGLVLSVAERLVLSVAEGFVVSRLNYENYENKGQ